MGAEERENWHRALIARWIAENPPAFGNGWEPYPLSLRIVNLIKWVLASNELEPEWLHNLAVQTRYLRQRMEWHLLGNHLFANAKALVFSGCFFEGLEADNWRETGLSILMREVPEQIQSDGGHFELSPMYHAIILEDLLDLINLAGAYPNVISQTIVEGWKEIAQHMRFWLSAMIHPDGQIAFFNDTALGVAPDPEALEDYVKRLGLIPSNSAKESVTHLLDSGYVRVQREDMAAFLDVAKVGPDYLPGHAHADTLSFELSLSNQRVIINSGTSEYGTGAERLRQRSTAAHSTVEVDGESSSEVWGGFRVARRARPFDLDIQETSDEVIVRCAHDGYRRLSGRVVHRREWCFKNRSLAVKDSFEGQYQEAVSRFFLHPEIKLEGGGNEGQLILPGGQKINWRTQDGRGKIVKSTWHPEFGKSVPGHCLEVSISGATCEVLFSW